MVTANEAARILRVTRQTVRAMIERGELEGFSRGKLTRVTPESLERLRTPLPEIHRPEAQPAPNVDGSVASEDADTNGDEEIPF